jgi:hypothetical protein
MKILLTCIILFTLLYAFKTEKEVRIGTHTFMLVEESYNEYGDKGVTLALYDRDANKSVSPKLTFLLRNEYGSCSDKDIEAGSYEIKKDSIVFYTHWKRSRNSDNAPIGNRIQVYKVDNNGSFTMVDSKIYVERTTQNEDADEGMQYLYVAPKTKEEEVLLNEYILSVENIFKAKFVRGDEAIALGKEVREALTLKQKQKWQ